MEGRRTNAPSLCIIIIILTIFSMGSERATAARDNAREGDTRRPNELLGMTLDDETILFSDHI